MVGLLRKRECERRGQIPQEYISMSEIIIATEKPRKINVPQTVTLHLGVAIVGFAFLRPTKLRENFLPYPSCV